MLPRRIRELGRAPRAATARRCRRGSRRVGLRAACAAALLAAAAAVAASASWAHTTDPAMPISTIAPAAPVTAEIDGLGDRHDARPLPRGRDREGTSPARAGRGLPPRPASPRGSRQSAGDHARLISPRPRGGPAQGPRREQRARGAPRARARPPAGASAGLLSTDDERRPGRSNDAGVDIDARRGRHIAPGAGAGGDATSCAAATACRA